MAGQESFATIAGCKTRIMRDGKGAPLLYLHGGGGAPRWTPFHAKLAESFDVIVPEHPGFGGSDTPEWLDVMGDLAFFYLDFIDQLGLKDVRLVGSSIGGWLACEIAVRNISRLKNVTLMAAQGIRIKGVAKADVYLMNPEQQVRSVYHDQKLADAALARPQTDAESDMAARNRLTMAKLTWEPRFFNPHLEKWLHRITVPTLIVWGDDDRIVPPAYAEGFKTLIPGSRVEIVKDCGHSMHAEKPEQVAGLVTAFAK